MKDWLREFHIFRNVYSEIYSSAACQPKVCDGFYVFYVLHCKKNHSTSNCTIYQIAKLLIMMLLYTTNYVTCGAGGIYLSYGNK